MTPCALIESASSASDCVVHARARLVLARAQRSIASIGSCARLVAARAVGAAAEQRVEAAAQSLRASCAMPRRASARLVALRVEHLAARARDTPARPSMSARASAPACRSDGASASRTLRGMTVR